MLDGVNVQLTVSFRRSSETPAGAYAKTRFKPAHAGHRKFKPSIEFDALSARNLELSHVEAAPRIEMQELLAKEQQEEQLLRDITGVQVTKISIGICQAVLTMNARPHRGCLVQLAVL